MRRTVMADKGPAPAGPYSHAVVANRFVFVWGQGPWTPRPVPCRMALLSRSAGP